MQADNNTRYSSESGTFYLAATSDVSRHPETDRICEFAGLKFWEMDVCGLGHPRCHRAYVLQCRYPSDGGRNDNAKVQPAIRRGHAAHRPIAPRAVLQVVPHLPLGVEPKNPGRAPKFLFAQPRNTTHRKRLAKANIGAARDTCGESRL